MKKMWIVVVIHFVIAVAIVVQTASVFVLILSFVELWYRKLIVNAVIALFAMITVIVANAYIAVEMNALVNYVNKFRYLIIDIEFY